MGAIALPKTIALIECEYGCTLQGSFALPVAPLYIGG